MEMALEIAKTLRLSSVGIDFIIPDISKSWKVTKSAVIEINVTPGISGAGDASLVLHTIFPSDFHGRIPVFVVIGQTEYQSRITSTLERYLQEKIKLTASIVPVDGQQIADQSAGDSQGNKTSERLLLSPSTDALILCSSHDYIIDHGLPIDACTAIFLEKDFSSAQEDVVDEIAHSQAGCKVFYNFLVQDFRTWFDHQLHFFRYPDSAPSHRFRILPDHSVTSKGRRYRFSISLQRIHCIPFTWIRQYLATRNKLPISMPDAIITDSNILHLFILLLKEVLEQAGVVGCQVNIDALPKDFQSWRDPEQSAMLEVVNFPDENDVVDCVQKSLNIANQLVHDHLTAHAVSTSGC